MAAAPASPVVSPDVHITEEDGTESPIPASPVYRPSSRISVDGMSVGGASVASEASSIAGIPMPRLGQMSDEDTRASSAPSFFDQKADAMKFFPLVACPVCKNTAKKASCKVCNYVGYRLQEGELGSISLTDMECVMMMDNFYDEASGHLITMEDVTSFQQCICARDFVVDNQQVAGGNLYDHSKREQSMKIPFLTPTPDASQPTDELDLSILRLYGINLSGQTVDFLTKEWEDRWLEAWSEKKAGVLDAARKKEWAKAILLRNENSEVSDQACQRFREEYCPRPMEFSYSGDWNANGQRHGQGVMRWQIFVTAADTVHRWQFVYDGSWKDGFRNGRGVLTAYPTLSENISQAVSDAHRFSVEAVWKDGIRLWTPRPVDTAGLEKDAIIGMAWPQYKAAADVEVPCPAYTGSFYPDGSRKKGTFKAHVGVPPLAIEAAFANADYHEHHSRRDTWPARSEYEGDWMRNMRCGYGTMKWKWDGKHKDAQNHPILFKAEYSGMWKDNMRDTSAHHDHRDFAELHTEIEDGEVQACRSNRSGKPIVGTMVFRNGDRYVGGWKNDQIHGEGLFWGHNRPLVDIEYAKWSPNSKKLIAALRHAHNRECAIGGVADADGMFPIEQVLNFTKHLTLTAKDGTVYNGFIYDDILRIKEDLRKDQPLQFRTDASGRIVAVGCKETWDSTFVAQNSVCGGRWQGQTRHGQKHGQITEDLPSGNLFIGTYSNGKRNGPGTFFWRRFTAPSKKSKKETPLAHQEPVLVRKYVGDFQQHLMHADGGFEGLLAWFEVSCEGPSGIEFDEAPPGSIRVIRLCGEHVNVIVSRRSTIEELRMQLAERTRVPVEDITLYSAPLKKHYILEDSRTLWEDKEDGYKYVPGHDTTILMWEPLRRTDGTLKYPTNATMTWVDYTSSPYNNVVRTSTNDSAFSRAMKGAKRTLSAFSSSSALRGDLGICGTWQPVRLSKKDLKKCMVGDVLPSRSMMFIERFYRPGPKGVPSVPIPYWVLVEDACADEPWFVIRVEGSWFRGKIMYSKCKLRKALPYGAPAESPREEQTRYVFYDIPGVALQINGKMLKEEDPPSMDVYDDARDDPSEILDCLISSLVVEGRSGHGREDWDAQNSQFHSLDQWSRLARTLRWQPDPWPSGHKAPWFAKIRVDKHFYQYHSKMHNDEDGHEILGHALELATSDITYNQLLTVILDDLDARCHVLGLVKEMRETTIIPPRSQSERPSATPRSYSAGADGMLGPGGRESEPVPFLIQRAPSWRSSAAVFIPHGAKKGVQFYGNDSINTLGPYRSFDLYLDGPFH